MRAHWDRLRATLFPTDFHSRMERYVGMDQWADTLDEDGEHGERVETLVAELATEAFADPRSLLPELSWLVTDEAKNGFYFGHQLGLIDTSLSLLDTILGAQRA